MRREGANLVVRLGSPRREPWYGGGGGGRRGRRVGVGQDADVDRDAADGVGARRGGLRGALFSLFSLA